MITYAVLLCSILKTLHNHPSVFDLTKWKLKSTIFGDMEIMPNIYLKSFSLPRAQIISEVTVHPVVPENQGFSTLSGFHVGEAIANAKLVLTLTKCFVRVEVVLFTLYCCCIVWGVPYIFVEPNQMCKVTWRGCIKPKKGNFRRHHQNNI